MLFTEKGMCEVEKYDDEMMYEVLINRYQFGYLAMNWSSYRNYPKVLR
jgi:hypothetical protein